MTPHLARRIGLACELVGTALLVVGACHLVGWLLAQLPHLG